MTKEEKKNVLAFYNVSEEQKKAIVESYNGNPEGYKASIRKMSEKEREVSLLIASACGIDIRIFDMYGIEEKIKQYGFFGRFV